MLGYEGRWCALDIESSKFPAGNPWNKGYFLSLVNITSDQGTHRTWVFTHNENKHNISNFIYDTGFAEIQEELNKYQVIVGHNLKYDINIIKYFGIDISKHKLYCTMVGEYLLNGQEREKSLDNLCVRYSQPVKDDRIKVMWNSGMDTSEIPLSILIPYCQADSLSALNIARKQYCKIIIKGRFKIFNLQMRFLNILSNMEINGFKWDQNEANKIIAKYTKYKSIAENKLCKLFGRDDININSGDDLSACLYGGVVKRTYIGPVKRFKNVKVQMPYVFTYKNGVSKIKLKWNVHPNTPILRYVNKERLERIEGVGIIPLAKSETKKSTNEAPYYKTGKDILPKLKTETPKQKLIVALLLKYSNYTRVLETFSGKGDDTGLMSKVEANGFIHTNYNQAVTKTGRLSSSNPNSQNLPRGNTSPIKRCIIPRFDKIVNGDLSQIEWRVPAFLSQDPVMMHEINNDIDQHAASCVELMELPFKNKHDRVSKRNRDNAKIFNFRMIYRGTEYGFYSDPKMPKFKLKRWGKIIRGFYAKYSGLDNWQRGTIKTVIDNRGCLLSPTGRLYTFPIGSGGVFNNREIVNYPVQGMAGGDILPLAAIYIDTYMQKYGLKSLMILTVHDSIVFDAHEHEIKTLTHIILHVFNNLPNYIKDYFGLDWNVKLTGEVEKGISYGQRN